MFQKGLFFLFGVLVAPVAKPILKNIGRPLAREVIKLGLATSEKVHQVAQEVREDLEDLTAEAAVERRTEKSETATSPRVVKTETPIGHPGHPGHPGPRVE